MQQDNDVHLYVSRNNNIEFAIVLLFRLLRRDKTWCSWEASRWNLRLISIINMHPPLEDIISS